MKKNVIWIVALLAAVAILAAVVARQNAQIAQLREQLASAAAKKVEAPPVAAPQNEVAEGVSESNAVEPVAAPVPTPAPAPVPEKQEASTGGATNFFAGLASMMKDPQMKEMVRIQQKMVLDKMYGSLFKSLSQPTDKQDALKDLLLDRQMAMVDAGMSMMGGSDANRKQAAEDSKAIKADYDKKISELLGPQDYEYFHQYEETVNERMQIQMFKDTLPADAALTDQQESDLIAGMYEARKTLPATSLLNNRTPDGSQLSEAGVADAMKQLEQLQQQYADRAATVLTPAQLDQFTKFQQQWSAMAAAGLKMSAQMFGNKAASPSGTPTQGQTP